MAKHIFFHNDIDGVFSAAIYAHYTKSLKDLDYVLHPVGTSSRGDRFESIIDKVKDGQIYIFDYQYNEKATLWIDHHQSPKIGADPVFNPSICYDNRSPSAVALVSKYIESELHLAIDDNTLNIVNSVNMVDSADYPSVEYIFTNKSPIMVMRAYLECSFPSEVMFCRCVEVLVACDLDVEKANKILNIDESCVDNMKKEADKVKDKLEVYGNISVLRQKFPYQYPRYSEYHTVNTMYGIRVSIENSSELRVSISFNKWCGKKNSVNIGAYCISNKLLRFGGGHYNTGGGVVSKSKIDEFLDSFSLLVEER